jgi:hypothetical protein
VLKIVTTPLPASRIQYVHLQLNLWAMNPPQIGPAAGLTDCTTNTIAIANERRSMGYKSATTAGARIITADPAVPARKRRMMRPGIFCTKLHPNKKALKTQPDTTMTGHRPNISLSGPRNKGPKQYPSRNMVIINEPTASEDVCRSLSV